MIIVYVAGWVEAKLFDSETLFAVYIGAWLLRLILHVLAGKTGHSNLIVIVINMTMLKDVIRIYDVNILRDATMLFRFYHGMYYVSVIFVSAMLSVLLVKNDCIKYLITSFSYFGTILCVPLYYPAWPNSTFIDTFKFNLGTMTVISLLGFVSTIVVQRVYIQMYEESLRLFRKNQRMQKAMSDVVENLDEAIISLQSSKDIGFCNHRGFQILRKIYQAQKNEENLRMPYML